jgi:hypothetical protein
MKRTPLRRRAVPRANKPLRRKRHSGAREPTRIVSLIMKRRSDEIDPSDAAQRARNDPPYLRVLRMLSRAC